MDFVSPGLVAYGRFLPTWTSKPTCLYVDDGMNSSVVVSDWGNGERNFPCEDMQLQRLLGNLPALVHPNPKSVLIVASAPG